MPSKRLMTSGSVTDFCSAAVSLSKTGLGVPLGAYRPNEMLMSKPFTPASAMAGVSGKEGSLFLPAAA
jgi:hypothetical protein